MIYTRWGNPVALTAYHGKHKPKWANVELMLVTVQDDTGGKHFVHAISLKADDGITEIEAAVDAAPMVPLSPIELRQALMQAE